jgi:hypothetical protein
MDKVLTAQVAATVSTLAAGRLIYDVIVQEDGGAEITYVGDVGKKEER